MNTATVLIGVCLGDEHALDLESFARACSSDADFIRQLVDEGLVQPIATFNDWHFAAQEIARVRRIRRLQHAFDLNLQAVAVMLDLMEHNERLLSALRRAGLPCDG